MSPAALSSVPSDLLKEFRNNLGSCWRQDTACGRHYIKTNKVQQWMTSVEEGQKATNLKRLLDEVWRPRPNSTFQPPAEKVSRGDDCAIIVFSILLDIGYGHLLDLFLQANINDASLSTTSAEHHYMPLTQYLSRANVTNANAIVETFKKRKWAFCPVVLKRRMHGDFGGGCVFPYCKREPVNGKGGTAQVFQVLVPAECIAEDLRQFLRSSMVEYKGEGQFYELALKSYGPKTREMFDWEKNAFAGLEDQKGMVRYIGHYSFEEEPNWWTYNILLEYGELDLDEFFADEFSSPPVRAPEIISFWESLFKVAEALQRIHNLKISQDGETQEFYGWHADVKPDNILRVHGEFKLVDFGFAKFKKKGSQAVPMEYMDGGTETYGAPETDQSRSETRTPHGQTIDTWSFGCVLSRAATWVILGQQGILQYDFVRKEAIKRLRERGQAAHKAGRIFPAAHDAFHNGRTVLPKVTHWHHYLRTIVRTSDTISLEVLDLVESKMLLENPEERISSTQLCRKLKDIVLLAKAKLGEDEFGERVDDSLLADLYNFDREAPANEAQANQPKPAKSTKASKRLGKSQRLDNIPPAKTAHRAEILTEELQISGPLQNSPQNQSSTVLAAVNTLRESPVCESPSGYIETQDNAKYVPPLRLSPASRSKGTVGQTDYNSWKPSEFVPPFHATSSRDVGDADGVGASSAEQANNYDDREGLWDDRGSVIQSEKSRGKMPLQETSPVKPGYHHRGSSRSTSQGFGDRRPADMATDGLRISTRRDSKLDSAQSPSLFVSSMTFADLHAALLMSPPLNINNYDICHVRTQLQQTRQIFTRKYRVDKYLRDFIVDRDMKFIVDNGSSMLRFWSAATYVLETLAMKLAPLDDDGLDLVFTSGHQRPYKGEGKRAAVDFANLMAEKRPKLPSDAAAEVKTDMTATLGVVFDEYLRSYKNKRMTLLVLTDGLWRGTKNENPVEAKIAKFLLRALNGNHMEDRRFSISFIRFGDYPEAIARLEWLDDEFPKIYDVPDMIDHVPWTGSVRKMILGSFVAEQD